MSGDLAARVRLRIREDSLLDGAEVVLAAVSGGLDSMVLLHLLVRGRVVPPEAVLAAVHIDHRMRPESAADAEWVAGVCAEWGVACHLRRASRPVATEAEGRRLRYDLFAELARDLGENAVVLTAHTADDQAETVLFRAARGSGPRGVVGIRPRRRLAPGGSTAVVRPLLPFRRGELAEYAAEHNVPHREDRTNRDLRWTRNTIRHRILPELERAVPGAAASLAHLAETSRAESAALGLLLDGRIAAMTAATPGAAGGFSFKRAELAAAPTELAAALLRRAVARLGGEAGRRATGDLLHFAREAGGGREVTVRGGVTVAREGPLVHIRPPVRSPPASDCNVAVGDGSAGPSTGCGPGADGRQLVRVVFTASEIAARVQVLGRRIGETYAPDDRLLLLATLKGSFIFAADLARAIPIPVQVDFMRAASYGQGHTSSGEVTLRDRSGEPVAGRHVVLLEDVVESGRTLDHLVPILERERPASLEVCVLLHKRLANPAKEIRWVGFDAPREFLVGYGLDYGEDYRHFPYICSLAVRG